MIKGKKVSDVDHYIAGFPAAVKKRLEEIRQTIRDNAPDAVEGISYGMPGFKYLGKPLVYFAGYENHIGFYATPTGHEAFKKDLAGYKTGKGSVQFPLTEPLPLALIKKIVQFRVKENEGMAAAKKKTGAAPEKKKAAKAAPAEKEATQVNAWLDKQEPAVRKEIDAVRKLIKKAAPMLNERIKWNAPSYYTTADLFTFGPYKNKRILLVFHHPAIVQIKSPLLEGEYKDRRLVYFNNSKEAVKNEKELSRIIRLLTKKAGNH